MSARAALSSRIGGKAKVITVTLVELALSFHQAAVGLTVGWPASPPSCSCSKMGARIADRAMLAFFL
jgi:hypothetical protein